MLVCCNECFHAGIHVCKVCFRHLLYVVYGCILLLLLYSLFRVRFSHVGAFKVVRRPLLLSSRVSTRRGVGTAVAAVVYLLVELLSTAWLWSLCLVSTLSSYAVLCSFVCTFTFQPSSTGSTVSFERRRQREYERDASLQGIKSQASARFVGTGRRRLLYQANAKRNHVHFAACRASGATGN